MNAAPRVRLAAVCTVVSGATPRTDNPNYWGGVVAWATPKDLSELRGSRRILQTADTLTEAGLASCSARILPTGSVLLTSRAPIGLLAINDVPMCTNQGFKSLIPGPLVSAEYLYWSLRWYRPILEASAPGSTFKELSKEAVERFEIPLPARWLQDRIGMTLDEADDLRKVYAARLGEMNALVRAAFHRFFGDPVANDHEFPVEALGGLAAIRRGASPRPIQKFLGGTVPWIKIGDASGGGSLTIEITEMHVSEAGAARSVMLEPGAIVIANSGVSLGFARILGIRGCIHDGWLSVEQLDSRVNPVYFVSLINVMTEHLRSVAQTGTQPNLNTGIVRRLSIPLPPLPLQQRFAEIVQQIYALRRRLAEAHALAEQLVASLSARYFG